MHLPSYKKGLAPRDGVPLYPSLWRGCVGAWAPCLGPSGTVLRDWSHLRNHADLTNMAPASDWVVANNGRAAGYALDLDGSNDYLNVPNRADYSFGDATVNIPHSISMWAKLTAVTASKVLIAKDDVGTNVSREWALGVFSTGVLRFYLKSDSFGANQIGRDTGNVLVANTWYHVAVTYNGGTAASGIKIYLNGTQADVANANSGTFTVARNGVRAVYIGARGDNSPQDFMPGQVDDIRIYARELRPNEIMLLAKRPGIAYTIHDRALMLGGIPLVRARFSNMEGNTAV